MNKIFLTLFLTLFSASHLMAEEGSDNFEIRSVALAHENGDIFVDVFLRKMTDHNRYFSLIFGSEIICKREDRSEKVHRANLSDLWGKTEYRQQFGMLLAGQWVHRGFVVKPTADINDIKSCIIRVGLGFDSDDSQEPEVFDTKISLLGDIKGWNNINLDSAFVGATLEMDRSVKSEKALVTFMFRNDSEETVSVRPMTKFIRCPPSVDSGLFPVQWSYNGAKSIGGMREIFIPSLELGSLTDVIDVSKDNSWKKCSLFYRFTDGHDSIFEYQLDLRDVPVGFRKEHW